MKAIGAAALAGLLLLCGSVGTQAEESAFRQWLRKDRDQMERFQGSPARTAQGLEGIYEVTGQDARWGEYKGAAEIRRDAAGGVLRLYQTRLYTNARFEGDRIALAWEGQVGSAAEPYRFEVPLGRVGFVTAYQEWRRAPHGAPPLVLKADFERWDQKTLAGTFRPEQGEGPVFTETWRWQSSEGPPVWRNLRTVMPAHGAPGANERAALFAAFAAFHKLPALQPYVDRPEFKNVEHGYVFDPTDFEFYRANPDVLRVIQNVPDEISLVEARIRNRAYRQSLAEKAAHFDADLPRNRLNRAGMLEYVDTLAPAGRQRFPDVDGMAWSGDYVASQAMRFLVTGTTEARDNMLRVLRGQILCHDIAGEDGLFARTARDHIEGATDLRGEWQWRHGAPPFAQYDWLSGCNNDMLKGYANGFLWASIALEKEPGQAALKADMQRIVRALLAGNPDAKDGKINEAYFRLLLYAMNDDPLEYARYMAMFVYLKPWLVDWGDGGRYEFGVSDWSGNHMHVKTLANFLALESWLARRGKKMSHRDDYRVALRRALGFMRYTRLGFFQLVAASLGDFDVPPPELQDALWVLREFAAPKVTHNYDWRINPEFCMSPVPNLPWKADWAKEDRTLSLLGYPLFERNPSSVQWKEIPCVYRGQVSGIQASGVDFLLAYWFGRYHGVIDENM